MITKEEDATYIRRRDRFIKEGLSVCDARDLAYKMLMRDKENVDLRVCFECKGMKGRTCGFIKDKNGKPTEQARFILQRCDQFQLKGK